MSYEDKITRAEVQYRREHAPEIPEGTVCCIAGCTREAEEFWLPAVCALSEAGIDPDWVGLCVEHDVELNEMYLRHLCGDKYDKELAAYRVMMLGE